MGSVRVAIVGVGNCATSLVQGVEREVAWLTELINAERTEGQPAPSAQTDLPPSGTAMGGAPSDTSTTSAAPAADATT